MHLRAIPIKWLKLFGGDIRRAIVGCIVASLLLAGGGWVILTKTAISWLTRIANTATPLWATISLAVLSALCSYLITAKTLAKLIKGDQSLSHLIPVIRYFPKAFSIPEQEEHFISALDQSLKTQYSNISRQLSSDTLLQISIVHCGGNAEVSHCIVPRSNWR